MNDLLIFS